MARGKHKENKGQKAAGQADGGQVEPVYEGLPGAVVLGICMGIVVQGLVGGVQADDHIVVGAVVGIGLGHEGRNTGEGGIKVRPYGQVIGIPGIIDIFSHGHHVVDGHFRRIGVDFIDGVIFGIKSHTEIKVGEIRHEPGIYGVIGREPLQDLIGQLRQGGKGLVGSRQLLLGLIAAPAHIILLLILCAEVFGPAL